MSCTDRVDHCVPIFRETISTTISFTYGMPAASSSVDPSGLPAPDADAPGGHVVDVVDEGTESPNIDEVMRMVPDDALISPPEGPIGDDLRQSKDVSGFHDPPPSHDSPKGESMNPKDPVDHL